MRVIDLMHLGRERVIGCWQVGEVLIDPGPSSCLPTLLEALGDARPAGAAADPHPSRPRRRQRVARRVAGPTSRFTSTSVARRTWSTPRGCSRARSASTATTWTGCGASSCPCPEENLRVLERRRDDPDGLRGGLHPGPRLPPCELPPRGDGLRRGRGRRPDHPALADDPADAAARHRPGGVAPVARSGRGAGRRSGSPSRTSARLRTSAPSSTSSAGGSMSWAAAAPAAGPGAVHRRGRTRRSRRGAGDPGLAAAYTQAAPPEQLYAGSTRYWRKAGRGGGRGRSSSSARPGGPQYPDPGWPRSVELPRVGGPGSGLGSAWRVIVLNDSHNTFDHVAETLAAVDSRRDRSPTATASPTGFTTRVRRSCGAARARTPSSTGSASTRAGLTMAPLESG